ncbi:MAG: SMP-30/gluconolactonase/LRE family protein [Devosia sp.]
MPAQAAIAYPCQNVVGESAIWEPIDQHVYWVDIVGRAIHRFHPGSGDHSQWATPDLVTSIGLASEGRFVVGLRKQVTLWHPGGTFEPLADIEPELPRNRLNEGVVAPDGTFWVGTMENNIGPNGEPVPISGKKGALYRVSPKGEVKGLTEHPFGITNTMIWLDDGSFVTADTSDNSLFRFSLAPTGETLTEPRPYGQPIDFGLPDGSSRDVAGAVYNCRVAGGQALAKIAPDGRQVERIDLPALSPTSVTFGGPDLMTLFVTTARFGLSDEQLPVGSANGALLSLPVDTPGTPPRRFG